MKNQIAHEILNQLGGRKFIAMTGSKNFVASENALSMHLTKNAIRAKYLRIELTSMDTYTMTFSTLKKYDHVVLATFENVYNNQLQSIFTGTTGLYTFL